MARHCMLSGNQRDVGRTQWSMMIIQHTGLEVMILRAYIGHKYLLRQGLSEPEFYDDLVYKLKKIVGFNNFSAQFIKIISHYKKIGFNINVLRQTACLVVWQLCFPL